MNKFELINRIKKFVIGVVDLYNRLPHNLVNNIFFGQLIRSSSSVGANYRAACRAKSSPDFINKLKIVEEEADESVYFLELLLEVNEEKFKSKIEELIKEGNELLAIFVSSIKTSKQNLKS